MWLLLPGAIFPNVSTGSIHLLVTTTALFNMSNFIRQNVHLGTVVCAHTFLNWEDQRVAASLRPAGDTVSSRPVRVVHSDTQVCLFVCCCYCCCRRLHIFWISEYKSRVCGKAVVGPHCGNWWFECRMVHEGVITPGAGNLRAATHFCNNWCHTPSVTLPHVPPLTKAVFFPTPLLLPCFQPLIPRHVP